MRRLFLLAGALLAGASCYIAPPPTYPNNGYNNGYNNNYNNGGYSTGSGGYSTGNNSYNTNNGYYNYPQYCCTNAGKFNFSNSNTPEGGSCSAFDSYNQEYWGQACY